MRDMQKMRPLAALALCGMVAIAVQGCVGLVAGGAIMTGFAVSDRRTLGAQTEDRSLSLRSDSRVLAVVGQPAHINATSFNRKLLLTGEVRSEEAKQAAATEAATIPGVETVFNELVVDAPSALTARSSDAFVTSKVVASLVDAKDVFANAYKVVTERGVVYLMGRVTQREGDRGAEIARGVSGVQKVVTLYEYLTEDELKQLNSRQASPAAPATPAPATTPAAN